jgi:predicted nucleic acid-binding protein
MAFVVDASVTMAWCFEAETTSETEALLERLRETSGVVPVVWPLEVANIMLVGERRGRITQAQTAHFVQLLGTLPIVVDDRAIVEAWGAILALGRAHNLSAYDAAYLELAVRQGLPLATQDARLRAAATAGGVPPVE